jgi:hypothetical protein
MTFKQLLSFRHITLQINESLFKECLLYVCPHLKNDTEYIRRQYILFKDAPCLYLTYFSYGEQLFNRLGLDILI